MADNRGRMPEHCSNLERMATERCPDVIRLGDGSLHFEVITLYQITLIN